MRKIQIGDSASFSKTITESDIYGFAGISGDFNSAHINQVESEKGPFGKRIAHGMLVGSLISTVLGTKLPGDGTIYLEQNLRFQKPVFIGDTITAMVTILEVLNENKGVVKIDTVVMNQDNEKVIEGYAIVMNKEVLFEKNDFNYNN